MSESIYGMKRTHRCTEVSVANVGETVTVMGWVNKRRDLGGVIFIDLRDRSGILQVVFNSEKSMAVSVHISQKVFLRELRLCWEHSAMQYPSYV